jgi:hypothetical protein
MNQDQGVFLLRPHDIQNDVIFLSFRGRTEDGVKHAIIRKEIINKEKGLLHFRCGRVGPCSSLNETLTTIARVLPSGLDFEKKLASTAGLKAKLSAAAAASGSNKNIDGSINNNGEHTINQCIDPNLEFWEAIYCIPNILLPLKMKKKNNSDKKNNKISVNELQLQHGIITSTSATSITSDIGGGGSGGGVGGSRMSTSPSPTSPTTAHVTELVNADRFSDSSESDGEEDEEEHDISHDDSISNISNISNNMHYDGNKVLNHIILGILIYI